MQDKRYAAGDTVVYAAQGVCRVEGIEQKDFGGASVEYYVLKPVEAPHSTVYVPVGNPALTGKMRRVLSPEEVRELIQAMPQEPSAWVEDENARKETYRRILSQGDQRELIRAIKAVYLHQKSLREQGKKLHVADERFFKEAEKILYSEFALVLHLQPDQVLPFIARQIEESGSRQEA